MARTGASTRLPGVTYAVCNTGPLISAFQSDSFGLLTRIFAEVHVPASCVAELTQHGWEKEVQAASPELVTVRLTPRERARASSVAQQIAQHPDSDDPVAQDHLGEAEAIVLALRSEYRRDILLLDELPARAVAKQHGIGLSGFPGALLLAVQGGLIPAEDLLERMEKCRLQGTHYSVRLIEQVYDMARGGRRKL